MRGCGKSKSREEAELHPSKKQDLNGINSTDSMIRWKLLLSHSQLSFTSCISTAVIPQPGAGTIRFVRNSKPPGLTTSEGSGSARAAPAAAQVLLDNVVRPLPKCSAARRSHVEPQRGSENGTRQGSVESGHEQLGVARSGVEQGQQKWWHFVFPCFDSNLLETLPPSHRHCRVRCLLAERRQ